MLTLCKIQGASQPEALQGFLMLSFLFVSAPSETGCIKRRLTDLQCPDGRACPRAHSQGEDFECFQGTNTVPFLKTEVWFAASGAGMKETVR